MTQVLTYELLLQVLLGRCGGVRRGADHDSE